MFTCEGPLSQDHLEIMLEVMIRRTKEVHITVPLEKLTIRSNVRGATAPVQSHPKFVSAVPLYLDYKLRDSPMDLFRCKVFELTSHSEDDRCTVYVLR